MRCSVFRNIRRHRVPTELPNYILTCYKILGTSKTLANEIQPQLNSFLGEWQKTTNPSKFRMEKKFKKNLKINASIQFGVDISNFIFLSVLSSLIENKQVREEVGRLLLTELSSNVKSEMLDPIAEQLRQVSESVTQLAGLIRELP